jgi:SpoVK/Ycf46/Vps4 family AAA+-type ATPase
VRDKAFAAAGGEPDVNEDTGHYQGFTRGARMLVFITATTEMPKNLPELKPEIIPLPGFDALKIAAMDILEPLWEAHKESDGKSGVKKCSESVLAQVVNAMTGLTLADAEEALTLALVRHGGMNNLDEFLDTIEKEKAKAIASIPGLTYIPKEQIVNEVPPGYEPLIEQLEDFIDDDGTVGLRGVSLGGPPGVAKTVTAKFIARYLKRIGLLLDVGATKGGIVGESEKNIRRVLQIADALMAVLVLDDIDKGGMNHGSGYGGDGGTTGNMIQAMLTMMSDPFCRIVFVFTFNRVPELPELLRFGRVDIRVYVEEPKNQPTRLGIFQYGLRQFGVAADDDALLAELAGKPTEGMTGAEIIHGIIKPAFMRAKKGKKKTVDTKFMRERAGSFTPMLQQQKYAADLTRLREDCSQFTKIGNLPDNAPPRKPAPVSGSGKANRAVAIL